MKPNPTSPGIDILNCGEGHTEIRFEGDAAEEARACRCIEDMLRRGYALFVHGEKEGELIRVKAFDPAKKCYVIAAGPDYAPPIELTPEAKASFVPVPVPPQPEAEQPIIGGLKRRGRPGRKEVPIGSVRVTAVGRSAGG